MANPPYSGSVIVLKEHQDGFTVDLYHWNDLADGLPFPPRQIAHILTAGRPGDPGTVSSVRTRNASTRADLISKFTAFVNVNFPDTP